MRSLPLLLLLTGCLARPVDLPPGDEDRELEDALGPRVILLATPQDSLVGILGAVVDPHTGAPTPTRRLVAPRSEHSLDYVRYEGVRALSLANGVAVDPFGSVEDVEATHVSYEVTVSDTHYLVGDLAYDTGGACCDEDGGTSAACELGYVTRVFVGTGTLRYLHDEATSLSLDGPVEVHDGVRYVVARERRFISSVFAIEVAPPEPICERAFCDVRSEGGACERCRVLGRQAELGSMLAPADAVLDVVCDGMRASADAHVSLRGDITVEDCTSATSARLEIRVEGAAESVLEVEASAPAFDRLTFSRRIDVAATGGGVAYAAVDVLDCRCGGAPARCVLDGDLELAISTR